MYYDFGVTGADRDLSKFLSADAPTATASSSSRTYDASEVAAAASYARWVIMRLLMADGRLQRRLDALWRGGQRDGRGVVLEIVHVASTLFRMSG